MIKFKGRSSMKQYLPKKPVKRGFKVWVRADAVTGYVCEFQVYTGKTDGQPRLGLGGNVVKIATSCVTTTRSTVTTFSLVLLSSKTFFLMVFMHAEHTRKCYPSDLKEKAKKGLGTWGSTRRTTSSNADTKTVPPIASLIVISRRQKTGSRVDVPCPESVRLYNRFMAGVDKSDQLRGNYKYIFWFLFDLAIVNAFILYSRVRKNWNSKNLELN